MPRDDFRVRRGSPEAYFVARLRERLEDLDFRKFEGFPIGSLEDILEFFGPAHYTAAVRSIGILVRTAIAPSDAGSGPAVCLGRQAKKNDPIYMAHSYHTKVPHKAILRYILHYTRPGDVVLDGFCGLGMTGVTATLCSDPDPEDRVAIEREMPGYKGGHGTPSSRPEPGRLFLAYNYNTVVDPETFEQDTRDLIESVAESCALLYESAHSRAGTPGCPPVKRGRARSITRSGRR